MILKQDTGGKQAYFAQGGEPDSKFRSGKRVKYKRASLIYAISLAGFSANVMVEGTKKSRSLFLLF